MCLGCLRDYVSRHPEFVLGLHLEEKVNEFPAMVPKGWPT